MDASLRETLTETGVFEYGFLSIARQGFRSAVEILAEAAAMDGKEVYIGPHVSGARSMLPNLISFRLSDGGQIPSGVFPIAPNGLLISHSMFIDYLIAFGIRTDRKSGGDELTFAIPHTLGSFNSGILMVCTPKAPEEIAYPVDFEGTVATVDAEAILLERLAVEPSPFGIAAIGLFLKATGDTIRLDAVRESIMSYNRFSKEIRKINVEAVEKAYEQTRVIHNHKIKGTAATPAAPDPAAKKMKGSTKTTGALQKGLYSWRSTLPVCDQTKCVCIECLAAYYCPEGAINWQDEVFHIDYDFCKDCGTCAQECTEHAITMEKSGKVLAELRKK